MWSEKRKFPIILGFLQVIFIVLFGVFGAYHESTDSRKGILKEDDQLHPQYPMFQDVHIMIFIGFGFLMTFLKRYGLSALGYNMLLSSVALQWVIIVQGIIRSRGAGFQMNIEWLVEGDFGAAAVLISFGALLGKTSPVQLLILVILEILVYAINFHIGVEILGAVDAGGSMMIHSFGAYFGLAAAFVLRFEWTKNHKANGSSYQSDMFAMIGSLFLWMCWPSFNAVLLPAGNQQHRAIVNSYLSLAASCVTAFITSSIVSKKSKFDMVHVQNATLAGGVAVGTCADMMVNPFGALLIGGSSGIISVLGYSYLTPRLESLGLHDTCGVHNLHGLPGILGGLAGVIGAGLSEPSFYGAGLTQVFAHRTLNAASDPAHIHIKTGNETHLGVEEAERLSGSGRSAGEQAGIQAAALVITLVLAVVGGLITGLVIKWSFWVPVIEEEAFQDDAWFDTPEAEEGIEEKDVELQVVGGKKMKYSPVAVQEPVHEIHVTRYE